MKNNLFELVATINQNIINELMATFLTNLGFFSFLNSDSILITNGKHIKRKFF